MNFLIFLTAKFFLFLVSTTVVQAFPIPMAGFFESSTKSIKAFLNSKKPIPKEIESNALDSNRRRINLLPSEPSEDKILNLLPKDSSQRVTDPISLSQRKLELELYLAKLNSIEGKSESKTTPKKLDEVNEIWKKKMNEEELTSTNPSLSTIESEIQGASLLPSTPVQMEPGLVKLILQKSPRKVTASSGRKVDLDLYLAKLNAMKAESESTTALAKIDKVNEMWKKKMGEETLISKNPSSSTLESELQEANLQPSAPIERKILNPDSGISNRERAIGQKEFIPKHKLDSKLFKANLNTKKAELDLAKSEAKFDKTKQK